MLRKSTTNDDYHPSPHQFPDSPTSPSTAASGHFFGHWCSIGDKGKKKERPPSPLPPLLPSPLSPPPSPLLLPYTLDTGCSQPSKQNQEREKGREGRPHGSD
eukprot:Sspe_Gene.19243::Locus_6991_Transcript_1_1_Confidence_1.000_Length_819::g.19243::m.19243